MRDEVRQLIDALLHGIAQDEDFARELAELAFLLEQDGNSTTARGMLDLSSRHRIKGIEARAKIAALSDLYSHLSLSGGKSPLRCSPIGLGA